jgi:hypothetical protein
MIKSVLDGAKTKIAAAQNSPEVQNLIRFDGNTNPGVEEEIDETEEDATADFTNPHYVEKLASACDWLAENIDSIEPPGPVAQALAKVAESGSPRGVGKGPSALPVSKAIGGTQKYKKDKPAGEDAAASHASTSLSTGGDPGGKTQVDNNMHKAPGQSSGSVPHAMYPAKGPLVNLKAKTAGFGDVARRGGELLQGGKKIPHMVGNRVHEGVRAGNTTAAFKNKNLRGEALKATGARAGVAGAIGGGAYAVGSEKNASAAAMDLILEKLAGEDTFKANISAKPSANPSAGKGQLPSFDANQAPPKASGGPTEGYGNQGRKHISSISAAINMTKKDAKGPVKAQLKEVLDEPAFSRKHDSKVHENLRNADKGGVKIASVRDRFVKVAQAGCTCGGKGECTFDLLKEAGDRARGREKVATMGGMGAPPPMGGMGGGMGGAGGGMGGMTSMAGSVDPASPEGLAEGERVRRLKLLLAQARGAAGAPGMGGPAEMQDPAAAGGAPVGAGVQPGPMGMV